MGADIAQEAFVRLCDRWQRIDSDDHARNFVLRVAVNLARSHVRRRLAAPFGLRGPEVKIPDGSAASEAWITVAGALGRLSPNQRASVILVDHADLDATTAGAILGIAEATVRVHLIRGRHALRAAPCPCPRRSDERRSQLRPRLHRAADSHDLGSNPR